MNEKKNKITLVLTGCINPGNTPYTEVKRSEDRKEMYLHSIKFYLENTNLPIVFVENTLTDISYPFKNYIEEGRFEYITFDGNNFDKQRGKGYGETLLMIYALENSELIRSSKHFYKITGQVIIDNIKEIINSKFLYFKHLFRCHFLYHEDISTISYIWQREAALKFFKKHLEEITEFPRGYWLEKIMYKGFKNDKPFINVIPFFSEVVYNGICYTTGQKYPLRGKLKTIFVNLRLLATLEKNRGGVEKNNLFLVVNGSDSFLFK